MKTVIYILGIAGLGICCVGTGVAQSEGKHLGSTEDVARTSTWVSTESDGWGADDPQTNYAGGKYNNRPYTPETGMYLGSGWSPGYAALRDQSVLDKLLLRYDIYHQQMQFISGADTMAFSHPEELDYIYLDGKSFVFEEFLQDGVVGKGYFELLRDGDCRLLLRRTVVQHVEKIDGEGNAVDEYLRDIAYFIQKDGQSACEVRLSWKGVLKAFADEEENVRQFMSVNDLKMNCCQDLVKVVAYYDSLH